MKKILLTQSNEDSAIGECVALLSENGKVILGPTETVYGLLCLWDDQEAIGRIRRMKRRDPLKSFQMLSDDIGKIEKAGGIFDSRALRACEKFCPGPITIILKSSNGGTIGFRIPGSGFILKLVSRLGAPLAATSANLSGSPPHSGAEEALADLEEAPDLLVDGGVIPSGAIASTVLDLSQSEAKIIRSGPVSDEDIRKVLG